MTGSLQRSLGFKLLVVAGLAAAGCGADGGAGGGAGFGLAHDVTFDSGSGEQDTGSTVDTGASSSGGSSSGGTVDAGWSQWSGGPADTYTAPLPKETEKIDPFGAPEGSDSFVYVPVSGEDTVVKVSGNTLKVSLVEVGDKPIQLKAVPHQDAVVVLNAGSDDVSVLRSTEDSDTVHNVPILPHCNRLLTSPDGQRAIAWYDHGATQPGDPTGSFQAVSIIHLDKPKPTAATVSVGFRPRDVQFDVAGKRAFVVTNDGVSVIELAKASNGQVAAPVQVLSQKPANPASAEVEVSSTGSWTVARAPSSATVTVTHLPTAKRVDVTLPSPPTDLDLAPDSSGALMVLPATKHVAWIDLPALATETLHTKIATIGWLTAGLARITDDGKTAVLYTSVKGVEQAAILDLHSGVVSAVKLRKTVDYVFIPPGSRKALLIHKPGDGPGHNDDKTEAYIDDAHGYTLFDLDTGFTKLILTPVQLTRIATVQQPAKVMMLLPDPQNVSHGVEVVTLSTVLNERLTLGSLPEHARALPKAKVVAITQKHASGRISFIHTNDHKTKTVTGFELNGLVK